jgi:hypothetical protein
MRTLATPLLEGDRAAPFPVDLDRLEPRQFVDLMDKRKALLLHGTTVGGENGDGTGHHLTTEDFGRFVAGLQLEAYPYVGGAAPRTIIPVSAGKDIVFTANERCARRSVCLVGSLSNESVALPRTHNDTCRLRVLLFLRHPTKQ